MTDKMTNDPNTTSLRMGSCSQEINLVPKWHKYGFQTIGDAKSYGSCIDLHHSKPWVLFVVQETRMRIWDYEEGKCITNLKLKKHGLGKFARFFPNKQWIVIVTTESWVVYHYEVEGSILKTAFIHQGSVNKVVDIAMHPVLPYMLTCYSWESHNVELWDFDASLHTTVVVKRTVLKGHACKARMVAFHPYKLDVFGSLSNGGEIKVWDIGTETPTKTFGAPQQIQNFRFCNDVRKSHLIAGGCSGYLAVWDYATGACVAKLKWKQNNATGSICAAFLHHTLPYIFGAGCDGTIGVWSEFDYSPLLFYSSNIWSVRSMVASPRCDELSLVIGGKGALSVLEVTLSENVRRAEYGGNLERETLGQEREHEKSTGEHRSLSKLAREDIVMSEEREKELADTLEKEVGELQMSGDESKREHELEEHRSLLKLAREDIVMSEEREKELADTLEKEVGELQMSGDESKREHKLEEPRLSENVRAESGRKLDRNERKHGPCTGEQQPLWQSAREDTTMSEQREKELEDTMSSEREVSELKILETSKTDHVVEELRFPENVRASSSGRKVDRNERTHVGPLTGEQQPLWQSAREDTMTSKKFEDTSEKEVTVSELKILGISEAKHVVEEPRLSENVRAESGRKLDRKTAEHERKHGPLTGEKQSLWQSSREDIMTSEQREKELEESSEKEEHRTRETARKSKAEQGFIATSLQNIIDFEAITRSFIEMAYDRSTETTRYIQRTLEREADAQERLDRSKVELLVEKGERIRQLTEENTELTDKLRISQHMIAELEKMNEQLMSDKSSLRAELEQKGRVKEERICQMEVERAALVEALNVSELKNGELEDKLRMSGQRIGELEKKVDAGLMYDECMIAELERKERVKEERICQLEDKRAQLAESLSICKLKNKELEDRLEKEGNMRRISLKERMQLEVEDRVKRERIHQLEDDKSFLAKTLEAAKRKIKEMNSRLEKGMMDNEKMRASSSPGLAANCAQTMNAVSPLLHKHSFSDRFHALNAFSSERELKEEDHDHFGGACQVGLHTATFLDTRSGEVENQGDEGQGRKRHRHT